MSIYDNALLDKYGNNIAAMRETVDNYDDLRRYAILLAQMQSGKTMTYKLIACEMMRQERVERTVIFSGTSDTDLRAQTTINPQKLSPDDNKFIQLYSAYLKSIGEPLHEWAIKGLLGNIRVVWGTQMKRFEKEGRTLFIWEESHYAQSQNQGVDKFLSIVGIDATGGCSSDDYALSVSATPFSELADIHNLGQSKIVVRLTPGEGYVGVKTLDETNRIRPYTEDSLPDILDAHDELGYIIMRAPEKMAERVEGEFEAKGWLIERCDMEHKMNLNAVLGTAPAQKTVIFIKGMLRMGKVLIKTHILCVIETGSKSDTILQGLLGRCCGYYTEHIIVYVKRYNRSEIRKFIQMSEGEDVVPCKGMNVRKKVHHDLSPCIPIKVTRTECVHGDRVWEDICPNILAARAPGDLVFHENDADPFWRGNTRVPEMRQRIKEVMFEARRATLAGEARGSALLVHKNKARWGAQIKHAWERKKDERNFEVDGRGGCGAGGADQVVVWEYSDTQLYITMQFAAESGDESVPETTGREVFCRASEFMYGGFEINVSGNTRLIPSMLESELRKFIQLSREHDSAKKITKNGSYNCIKLAPNVFAELAGIKERLQEDGVELAWKKKTGKKDPRDVCLSEISWTFEPMAELLEVDMVMPVAMLN